MEAKRVDVTWQPRELMHRQFRIDQLVIRGARLIAEDTRMAGATGHWLGEDNSAGKISLQAPTLQVIDSQITFRPAAPGGRRVLRAVVAIATLPAKCRCTAQMT